MALFSNTLAGVRQYVSGLMGDLITGTADSGSTSTIVDTMLRKGDDYYNAKGYECYIYAGINIGEVREVDDWTKGDNTLSFIPNFTSAIDNTSKYELHYIFTEKEYRRAINLAIENLAGKYLVDIKDESTITLVADTYEYALPTSMLYLTQVTTEDTADGGEYFDRGIIDPRSWDIINAYPAKLRLDKRYYSVTADKDLRLEGQGTQPIVDGDTDIIYIPPDWLVQKAITFLPHNKIEDNQLDSVFRQALILSVNEPRANSHPFARSIVE